MEHARTHARCAQVRDANVVAALSIANVVKSSLGPVGLDKSRSAGACDISKQHAG